MDVDRTRMQVLEMIEAGQISTDQGLRLLEALAAGEMDEAELEFASPPPPPQPVVAQSRAPHPVVEETQPASTEQEFAGEQPDGTLPQPQPADFERWRRLWILPVWAGAGLTAVSGLLMLWALQTSGLGFWFALAGLPLAFGVLLIVLGWQARTARWLHLRIEQKPGRQPQLITLSFPLPLRLSSWLLRLFGNRIPSLKETSVDEMLLALSQSTTPDNPLWIEVVDEEDGERVQIYFG